MLYSKLTFGTIVFEFSYLIASFFIETLVENVFPWYLYKNAKKMFGLKINEIFEKSKHPKNLKWKKKKKNVGMLSL